MNKDIIRGMPVEPVKVGRYMHTCAEALSIGEVIDLRPLSADDNTETAVPKIVVEAAYKAAGDVMEELGDEDHEPVGAAGAGHERRLRKDAVKAWVCLWLSDVTHAWNANRREVLKKLTEMRDMTFLLICAAIIELRGGLDVPWSSVEYTAAGGSVHEARMPRPDRAKFLPGVPERPTEVAFSRHFEAAPQYVAALGQNGRKHQVAQGATDAFSKCRTVFGTYLERMGHPAGIRVPSARDFQEVWAALAAQVAAATNATSTCAVKIVVAKETRDVAAGRGLRVDELRPAEGEDPLDHAVMADLIALVEQTQEDARREKQQAQRERDEAQRQMDEMKERIAALERIVAAGAAITAAQAGMRRERDETAPQ